MRGAAELSAWTGLGLGLPWGPGGVAPTAGEGKEWGWQLLLLEFPGSPPHLPSPQSCFP